jgi:hypothetical protein
MSGDRRCESFRRGSKATKAAAVSGEAAMFEAGDGIDLPRAANCRRTGDDDSGLAQRQAVLHGMRYLRGLRIMRAERKSDHGRRMWAIRPVDASFKPGGEVDGGSKSLGCEDGRVAQRQAWRICMDFGRPLGLASLSKFLDAPDDRPDSSFARAGRGGGGDLVLQVLVLLSCSRAGPFAQGSRRWRRIRHIE